jgi:signal transduction histidine kinase
MRTSPANNKAPAEMGRPSDAHSALAESRPIPTVARVRGGLGESGRVRYLRLPDPPQRTAQPRQAQHPPRGPAAVLLATERRRLERDLHDGVQNELIALIVKLALAQQDPRTPSGLADLLAGLEARAQAALDSVRDIARGIYPPLLSDFGLERALRSQAARAAIPVSLVASAPRSSEEAEEAVYFSCAEAIQNAAKHGGPTAKVKLSLQHQHGTLALRIADDGRGFDAAHTPNGAGLQNIRERIEAIGGSFKLASNPGRGTVLTFSLPWPARAGRA